MVINLASPLGSSQLLGIAISLGCIDLEKKRRVGTRERERGREREREREREDKGDRWVRKEPIVEESFSKRPTCTQREPFCTRYETTPIPRTHHFVVVVDIQTLEALSKLNHSEGFLSVSFGDATTLHKETHLHLFQEHVGLEFVLHPLS